MLRLQKSKLCTFITWVSILRKFGWLVNTTTFANRTIVNDAKKTSHSRLSIGLFVGKVSHKPFFLLSRGIFAANTQFIFIQEVVTCTVTSVACVEVLQHAGFANVMLTSRG